MSIVQLGGVASQFSFAEELLCWASDWIDWIVDTFVRSKLCMLVWIDDRR